MSVDSNSPLQADLGRAAVENALEHFGVKGMKWGVQNSKTPQEAMARSYAGVMVGGYLVKPGYSLKTAVNFKLSGDLNKINNSPQFKGKDIRSDKKLHRQYKKAVADGLQKHETRKDRFWRYLDGATDVLWMASVATRVLHSEESKPEMDIIGFSLDERGFATGFLPNDALPPSEIKHSFLEHFGIKGMRWGVRRTQEQLDSAASASDPTVPKVLPQLSNSELKNLVERIKLEQEYTKLTQTPSEIAAANKGESFAKNLVVKLAKDNTAKLASATVVYGISRALGSKDPQWARLFNNQYQPPQSNTAPKASKNSKSGKKQSTTSKRKAKKEQYKKDAEARKADAKRAAEEDKKK